jgi:hypothetical protein
MPTLPDNASLTPREPPSMQGPSFSKSLAFLTRSPDLSNKGGKKRCVYNLVSKSLRFFGQKQIH